MAAAPTSTAVLSLHNRVHAVVTRAQSEDGAWSSPLETALGALALASHPVRATEKAERAVDRLHRWLADGALGNSSADVAALAVAARAAAVLQRRRYELATAATERIEMLVAREQRRIASLHLVFCAWGLAAVESDRSKDPWPQLLERLRQSSQAGVADPLAALGEGIALGRFDTGLLRRVIGAVARESGLAELAVLLWVEDVVISEAASATPVNDSGVAFLIEALAAGIDRLDAETTEATFIEPDLPEYTPEEEFVQSEPLTTFEAILIDLVLAPRSAEGAILAPEQAEAFVKTQTGRFRLRVLRGAAAALALLGLASATVAAVLIRQLGDHSWHQWLSVGTAVILFGLLVAGFLLHADERNRVGLDALSVLGITTALAGLVTFDQFRKNPVSDPQLLIGIAFTALVFALNTIAGWLRKPQK
jgi:hypothetical protein